MKQRGTAGQLARPFSFGASERTRWAGGGEPKIAGEAPRATPADRSPPGEERPCRLDRARRIFLLRHVPQIVDHDHAAARDVAVKPLRVGRWNQPISPTPENQRRCRPRPRRPTEEAPSGATARTPSDPAPRSRRRRRRGGAGGSPEGHQDPGEELGDSLHRVASRRSAPGASMGDIYSDVAELQEVAEPDGEVSSPTPAALPERAHPPRRRP